MRYTSNWAFQKLHLPWTNDEFMSKLQPGSERTERKGTQSFLRHESTNLCRNSDANLAQNVWIGDRTNWRVGQFHKWDEHPARGVLHKRYKGARNTTNDARRAEGGRYPFVRNIQKRAIEFWKHLKESDPHAYHYKNTHISINIRISLQKPCISL